MGHSIVMGRKTYETIGRPLPGRTNIILTRDPEYKAGGCLVFHTKEDLLEWASKEDQELFITGGAEIFRLFMEEADRLYVTKIDSVFEGDTYFPDVQWDRWRLASSKPGIKNEKNPYDYRFLLYERA